MGFLQDEPGIFSGSRNKIFASKVSVSQNMRIGNNLLLKYENEVMIGEDIKISSGWKTIEHPIKIGSESLIRLGGSAASWLWIPCWDQLRVKRNFEFYNSIVIVPHSNVL
jgi:hypothetical protein